MNSDGKMRLAAYFNPTGHSCRVMAAPACAVRRSHQHQAFTSRSPRRRTRKFDLVFLADGVATRQADIEAQSRSVQFIAHFERSPCCRRSQW